MQSTGCFSAINKIDWKKCPPVNSGTNFKGSPSLNFQKPVKSIRRKVMRWKSLVRVLEVRGRLRGGGREHGKILFSCLRDPWDGANDPVRVIKTAAPYVHER